MKKVLKRKGDIIIQGLSSNIGISFTVSKNFLGPFMMNGPMVTTTISEGRPVSKITNEWYDDKFMDNCRKMEHITKDIVGMLIFVCFIFIAIFSGTYWMRIFMSLLFILISMLMNSEIFVLFIGGKILRRKEYFKLMKYHAAEHAVINGFYDLGRVPTKEEIKCYSNFSLGCSSLPCLYGIAGWWILAIAVLLPNYWCTVFVGLILYILFATIYRKEKLYFMEILVTSNPTDSEYEVAISGLTKALDEYEKHNSMTFTRFPMRKPLIAIKIVYGKEK